jgi:formylglycine-generating enzyme required for sulfatase activity
MSEITKRPQRLRGSEKRLQWLPKGFSASLCLCGLFVIVVLSARPLGQTQEEMARIPAGDYWMGRTRLWLMDEIGWQLRDRADDRPVHRVNLPAFLLDVHEVTNGEYAALVAKKGVEAPYHWGGRLPSAGKERLPIYNVSWHDAVTYCKALGKRLPTEAEWERAARGGTADLDYPWGNDYADEPAGEGAKPAKRAQSGSASGPLPVGSFAANAYGLYDMSGNVWEWVADWYDLNYYSVSPTENPPGPARGLYKVIRGGGWADTESRYGTVYFRNFTLPDTRQPTIGFRCVRSTG